MLNTRKINYFENVSNVIEYDKEEKNIIKIIFGRPWPHIIGRDNEK
mgnify:CR=1 FL=1